MHGGVQLYRTNHEHNENIPRVTPTQEGLFIDHRNTLHAPLDKFLLAFAFSVHCVHLRICIQNAFNHLSKRALYSSTEDQLCLIRNLEEPQAFVPPTATDRGLPS